MSQYSQSNSRNTSTNSNSTKSSITIEDYTFSKESKCDGTRLNINLLFLAVLCVFLYLNIKGDVIPKDLFSKKNIMDGLNRIIPNIGSKEGEPALSATSSYMPGQDLSATSSVPVPKSKYF